MAHANSSHSEKQHFSDEMDESVVDGKILDLEDLEELQDLVQLENPAFFDEIFGNSDEEEGFNFGDVEWKRDLPCGENYNFTAGPTGSTCEFENNPSQLECFELFFDKEVWDLLIERKQTRRPRTNS